MVNLKKLFSDHFWILILPLSYFSLKALFVPGFYGASDDLHVAWLYELDRTIRLGQIPPRFVPDLSYGFGYPLFNFVFPFPFYVGEIIHLIGLNLVDSIKTVFILSLPLSGIAMYQFLKTFTSKYLSLAGAVVYMYIPYRATDIYVRGAIGEIVSFIFLPLIALSVVKLSSDKKGSDQKLNFRWIGVGALSLAGLVLTHNITAYMFLPFIAILALIRFVVFKSYLLNLLNLLVSFILGLILSLYFWLPAILDSNLMKYDTVFNYVDHFPTLQQLIIPFWGYGASVPGPNDGISFFLGSASLSILLIGLLLTILKWNKLSENPKIIIGWAEISFLIAFFMMNFRAIFIWQNVPLIPYFQFPWRFLIIITFVLPIIVVAFDRFKYHGIIAFTIISLALMTTGGNFHPHDFLGRDDSYYLNRYIPYPVASEEYTKTQEEYLRLPEATTVRPDKNFPRTFPQTEQIIKVNEINSLTAEITTQSKNKFIINYNKYYFPGWWATIDNQKTEISAGYPFGQIELEVPAGEHRVKIGFEETWQKRILDIISFIGFLTAIICTIDHKYYKKWRTR